MLRTLVITPRLNMLWLCALIVVTQIACATRYERSFARLDDPNMPPHPIAPFFQKHLNVFGVDMFASHDTPDAKVLHAANVLAKYLDNDEDGIADNPAVVAALHKNKAAMVMFATEGDANELFESIEDRLDDVAESYFDALQDLYGEETHPNGAEHGQFDGALEEVLHLVTHVGYANAYPEVFGERAGTDIAKAMDVARGGYFEEVPNRYPQGAWYTYDDETCDYSCMVTEYTYWALTSMLGGQSFTGRLEDIDNEWRPNTHAKVRQQDQAVFNLLSDPRYKLPTTLPDGRYAPKTFRITHYESRVSESDGSETEESAQELLQQIQRDLQGYKIAFSDEQDIYMMNPDGSELTMLADGSPIAGYVSWGHDARHVYYVSAQGPEESALGSEESAWEAFRVNVKTKAVTQLSQFGRDVRSMAPSPDGRYLALSLMTGNSNIGDNNDNLTQFNTNLYIISQSKAEAIWQAGAKLAVSDLKPLVTAKPAEQFWFEELHWNPQLPADKGEPMLAYTKTWRYDEDDVSYTHAYTIRADGSDNKLIAKHKDMPIFGFEDNVLCFIDMSCMILDTDINAQLDITGIDEEVSAAALSPGSDYVLFEVGDEDRHAGIARFDPEGRSVGVILEGINAYEPRWSPRSI